MYYVIRGKYPDSEWEDIDWFDTHEEAKEMLAEYQTAYGPEWLLTTSKRLLIDGEKKQKGRC